MEYQFSITNKIVKYASYMKQVIKILVALTFTIQSFGQCVGTEQEFKACYRKNDSMSWGNNIQNHKNNMIIRKSEAEQWLARCPDPNLLLRIPSLFN